MPPSPGWHEGLEQWARLFGNSSQQGETVERARLASAKSYVAMIQSLFTAAAQGGAQGSAPDNPQAWLDAMRNGLGAQGAFNMPGADVMLASNPFLKALKDMVGQGAHGFGELPDSFAPFLEPLRAEGLSWLRVPAFGVGREHQEHYQRTALALVDYQQAMHAYNALMLKASQRGFELLEDKLADRGDPGRTIDSARALYDLWVDAAEEAYAQIALSDEFGKVYGELANAQMRVRAQIQAEVERIGTDLGMPTRSELNSVHKRLHDLRRDLREGKLGSQDSSAFETELAALREEVDALKTELTRARKSSPAPVTPPTPANKPSAPVSAGKPKPQPKAQTKRAAKPPRERKRVRSVGAVAPVVRPHPVAAAKTRDDDAPRANFGDAIAAMRKRVARKSPAPRLKSVKAEFAKPAKHSSKAEKSARKSGKRKG